MFYLVYFPEYISIEPIQLLKTDNQNKILEFVSEKVYRIMEKEYIQNEADIEYKIHNYYKNTLWEIKVLIGANRGDNPIILTFIYVKKENIKKIFDYIDNIYKFGQTINEYKGFEYKNDKEIYWNGIKMNLEEFLNSFKDI